MSGTSAMLNYETYTLLFIHDLSRIVSQTTLFADITSVQHTHTHTHTKSYNSADESSHQFSTNENNEKLKSDEKVSKNPEY